ncbi:MAG TPA: peptidoglycan editing factor PgeF [Mobilitalea sp.]|nr:peptidoglycan editing factor PgeF [Mobilitalea sp.]
MNFTSNNSAQIDYNAQVPYLTFPVLSDISFLKHGFSTRLGGVSKGIYSTMNLGSDSTLEADDAENIKENFERISESIGIDPHSIVISKQVHKTNIRLVDEKDCGKGLYTPRDYDEVDGLITDRPGITLVTKYADCVPLFFVDPINRAIGLTHSGWRGTVAKIGLLTVNEMKKCFGTDPKDVISVIGPSICGSCYEVGEEVANKFQDTFMLKHSKIENNILTYKDNGKYELNLWQANRSVLMEAGLRPEHIHVSGVCTACNSDLLFSHRRTGGKRGSLAAFLAISESGV